MRPACDIFVPRMSALARDAAAAAELARRLGDGDRVAMQAAFAEHGPLVARTVRALSCSDAAREDLVQEVFVVAFTRIGAYDERVPLAAWLRGIAVNVVRAHRRKEARRGRLRERFASPPGERTHTPEEALAARRLGDRLWDAVDALPDRHREPFVLRVIEQLPLAVCAEVLGTSIKSVSRRALRAEQVVRAAIEEEEESA
jgi:RNA polymerase sigma factor (sigma-70 family)